MAGKHLSLLVHFVWSTANREPWIDLECQDDLYGYIGGIMKKKNGRLICAGGTYDHIHLYASLPSTITIADFVSVTKSNSSRWIHESFPKRKAFAWQEGYGVLVNLKSRRSSGIFRIRSDTMRSEILRMSFVSF